MNRKLQATLRTMVSPGDHVICAVSGGRDSMALLHGLHSLSGSLQISVSAAHFNHHLRGEESMRDGDFVRDYCAEHHIPFFFGEADPAAYGPENLEDAARRLRYDFLLSIDPAAKIATAHTAEDNLETLLMRLVRGTGLHGLAGIPPVRGNIIRPMLDISRQEIADYLENNHIPHVEDATNQTDFCLRNRIRHHVLPLLLEENPNLPQTAARTMALLRQEDEYLEALAGENLGEDLPVPSLLALPEAVALRILRKFLADVPRPTAAHYEAALALCKNPSPSARLSLPGGYTLLRQYDALVLTPPESEQILPEDVTILPGQTVTFGPWQVTCQTGPAPSCPEPGTVALRNPGVPLTLRTRRPGDRICLPGGTKKLSRHLIDLKIPAGKRDTLPILTTGETLLALLPHTVAIPWRTKSGSDSLILTVIERE